MRNVIRRPPISIPRLRRPMLLRNRLLGRRISDPVDLPLAADTQAVRGRLAAVSVRASIVAGAWVGVAIGTVIGAGIGALVVWFSGAILDWQRDLAFTFGVARQLLPFGDQQGFLREIGARWWLVIPAIALTMAALSAIVGALLGGILAAAYNRSPRHAMVIVELPRAAPGHRAARARHDTPTEVGHDRAAPTVLPVATRRESEVATQAEAGIAAHAESGVVPHAKGGAADRAL